MVSGRYTPTSDYHCVEATEGAEEWVRINYHRFPCGIVYQLWLPDQLR